jgi:hypothetical protein
MQLSSTQETLQPLCSQSERSPVITGPYFRQVVLVKTADSGIKQYTRMLHVQNRSPNRPDPNIDPRVALIMRCIGILFQAARKVSRWHSSSSQRIAAHRSSVAEKCQVPGVSTKPISWAKVTWGKLSLPLEFCSTNYCIPAGDPKALVGTPAEKTFRQGPLQDLHAGIPGRISQNRHRHRKTLWWIFYNLQTRTRTPTASHKSLSHKHLSPRESHNSSHASTSRCVRGLHRRAPKTALRGFYQDLHKIFAQGPLRDLHTRTPRRTSQDCHRLW